MNLQKLITAIVACGCLVSNSVAQDSPIFVERPHAPIVIRPYIAPRVPPVRLRNSTRLHDLMRAGKIYLTVQDAIALAIENSLDLEVDRYGPLISEWQAERAEAGGLLRGVPSGSSQVGNVASGQGVAGSIASAGLGGGGGGSGGNGGNAVIQQIGPVTANLDPVLQHQTLFSHTTYPQPNTVISQTTALVDTQHIFNNTFQQGLLSGGFVRVLANESYLKENTPSDIFNPSVAPRVYIQLQHNLLQGLGAKVNGRNIRVARRNMVAAQETFRSQLLNLVAGVLNLYWDLVTDNDDLKARQRARDVAQKFYEDTKKEIELGEYAKVEIYRAEAEVATRQRDLVVSQAAVSQQESLLKQALIRSTTEDPQVEAAEIVPLDRFQVPESDDLPPLKDLVAKALTKRPDIAISKVKDETAEISAIGTTNGLLPTSQGFVYTWDAGAAGTPHPVNGLTPNPYFVGGLGTALGQVFRRDFPNNRAGAYLSIPLGNRVAQGDYGIDQLQLRQSQLSGQRDMNQIVVDISNQMVALRQARVRYSTAADSRILQEQLLDLQRQNFTLGGSTINDLIVAQRSVLAAQSAEIAALSAYSHARIALDQVLGQTLETNRVSIDEATKGRVAVGSKLPEP